MPDSKKTMPDVGSLFRRHFEGASKKLNLLFGSDSDFVHNLEFLSVLTHESRLQTDKVRWKERGPIRFPMVRERTELPLVEAPNGLSRTIINSVLSIEPVSAVSWVFQAARPAQPTDLELFSIHLGLNFWDGDSDSFTLHLVGQLWRCDLTIGSRSPVLKLSDTSSPSSDRERRT